MSTPMATAQPVRSITAREFRDRRSADSELVLLDVRTPVEFDEVHVRGAWNRPLDELDPREVASAIDGEATIHVVCRSGKRGERACRRLREAGVQNVVNVEGGTLACIEAGLPVERGRTVISLERQVRIAAGSLVLLGAVLAMTVHVAFAGLSAFVGAGLIFAGVTDTCGMGLLLARMPWNRTRAGTRGSDSESESKAAERDRD